MGDDVRGVPGVVEVAAGVEADVEVGEVSGDDEAAVGGAAAGLEVLLLEGAVAVAAPGMGLLAAAVALRGEWERVGIVGAGDVAVDGEAGHVPGAGDGAGVAVLGAGIDVACGGVGVDGDVLVAVVLLAGVEGDGRAKLRAGDDEVFLGRGGGEVVVDGHAVVGLVVAAVGHGDGAGVDGKRLLAEGVRAVDARAGGDGADRVRDREAARIGQLEAVGALGAGLEPVGVGGGRPLRDEVGDGRLAGGERERAVAGGEVLAGVGAQGHCAVAHGLGRRRIVARDDEPGG